MTGTHIRISLTLLVTSLLLCRAGMGEVGDILDDFQLKDYHGKDYSLSDFNESQLLVVAFVGTECPLVKLYSGKLQELSQKYPQKQVRVVAVNSLIQDSISEIAAWADHHQLTFPILKDPAQILANKLQAQRTPQVFLLDAQRVVRYSGRIDDQFVVGIARDQATREDLQIAIDELLSGKLVSVKKTEPLGCIIARAEKPNENSQVTYSNQIARIFENHCVSCHREGEIAPFPLRTYADVQGWGPMIAEVVRDQKMPPWHANPKHGNFSNDASLSQSDKNLIFEWVKNGSPEGNPRDLPEPKQYVAGWQLPQTPDVVFEMAREPFQVAASAGPRGIPYQRFWVDTKFTEDKWVVAAEARPGNREVVHHIIVYVHPQGMNTREHEFFCAYVPGLRLQEFLPGVAKKIPAGSALRFEMHYTPIGSPQEDISSVGFIFTEPEQVTQEIRTLHVGNSGFELKPFEDDQVVTARSPASPTHVKLLAMSPHMHLRGKSFRYEALLPDGTREVLLDVPHYDFNWQTQYRLAEPLDIAPGTRLVCTATFNNSESNLANPDPSATVRWGDQSWDEMMLGYYDILLPVRPQELESKTSTTDGSKKPPVISDQLLNVDLILQLVDKNKDKLISLEEAQGHPILLKSFDRIDIDRDGSISEDELDKVIQHLKTRR